MGDGNLTVECKARVNRCSRGSCHTHSKKEKEKKSVPRVNLRLKTGVKRVIVAGDAAIQLGVFQSS